LIRYHQEQNPTLSNKNKIVFRSEYLDNNENKLNNRNFSKHGSQKSSIHSGDLFASNNVSFFHYNRNNLTNNTSQNSFTPITMNSNRRSNPMSDDDLNESRRRISHDDDDNDDEDEGDEMFTDNLHSTFRSFEESYMLNQTLSSP
jgi:hypothetical protein